ncbi:MAG: ComF family protein [Ruminiclostridium sp.]|nr:ComF family protein [Ruminiclostridium sp.]
MSIDRAKLHSAYRYILDWFFPNRCPGCRKFIAWNEDFCPECAGRLTVWDGKTEIPFVDRFTAYCVYDKKISPVILRLKRTDRGNSCYAFARGIKMALERSGMTEGIDCIVPIPMSKKKLKERGYNQAELIARELSYMIGAPCSDVLVKVRDTAAQKSLGREDRAKNLKNAFSAAPGCNDVKGRSFLLIDDVCTTGSTFAEAASVLAENGAARIYAASFAKTPNKRSKASPNDIPEEEYEDNVEDMTPFI